MCRRVRLVPSVVAAAALLLAGCTGDDGSAADDGVQPIEVEDGGSEAEPDPEPEPEVGSEAESQPEPEQAGSAAVEPDDPFAFDDPSEIDADYVDRVMAELLAVNDQLLDDVLRSDPSEGLTELDNRRLRAIFSGPRLIAQANSFQARATDEAVRAAFLPELKRQGTSWTTARVMLAEGSCLVAIGHFDISGTAVQPYPPDEFGMVVLSRKETTEDAELADVNVTPWRIHEQIQLVSAETGEPVPEGEWDSLDFRAALDMPCSGE